MNPRKLAVALIAALALTSCGLVEPAAAVVNGEKIPIGDIQKAVDDFKASPEFARLGEQGDSEAITREFEQSYLATLIRRKVLTPEAAARGIEVTPDEVQSQLDDIKGEFANESAFEEAVKEQGLTLEQLEQLIADRALEQKLRTEITADLAPTDDEIEVYYNANIEQFLETEAQHILVAKSSVAQAVADQLQAAPKAKRAKLFAQLAKRYSTDKTNKDDGGKLGFFKPGDFVPEFEQGADALEIGEISDPVQTEFGFHVIWVTDRREAPLETVRDQIITQLSGADEETTWQKWVQSAYRDADVSVNPRFGEFNFTTQQIEDASPRTVPGAEQTPAGTPRPEHTH
ncbi:MAG: foldase protein PrsA [Actinomycetota bacterium]|jgi:foldase protein PrsA|nr:foldase protein PrsA [Actinomycetota bacterium]